VSDKTVAEYPFALKYDSDYALTYYQKHHSGFWRRLSSWREIAIARKALRLAGNPDSVLDIPSGAGRFWQMLAESPGRCLIAADFNQAMLDTALARQKPQVSRRFETLRCSAFDIPRPDNFVDTVFCMRLIHHIHDPADRVSLLRELARVARRHVIISLWVSGNLQAHRRSRLDARRASSPRRNRFMIGAAQFEQEVREAGLRVCARLDLLPGVSMWRVYLLEKP
jgi:SAM-dependent methyltransferase